MRSAQLLTVAAQYPEFPIVLETMRECLNDVFDLDGLLEVQRQVASRSLRIVEVETKEPSPFARSLLFGYVGAFVYEGDVPLAEKKAAALSLDATLLAELLGKDGIKQLLDADVIASIEADLQCLSAERQVATLEQRLICCARPDRSPVVSWRHELRLGSTSLTVIDTLISDRRVVELRIAGQEMLAVLRTFRDSATASEFRCRRVWPPPSPKLPQHPIDDLVLRWARTHGPFVASRSHSATGWGARSSSRPATGWSRPAPWSPVRSSTCRARQPSERVSTATVKCWP